MHERIVEKIHYSIITHIKERFKITDLHATNETEISTIQEHELKELVSNYAELCEIDYSTAFQEFNEEFMNEYGVDASKLKKGRGTEYQEIVSNGLFDKARDVLLRLIINKSDINNECAPNTAKPLSQLTNVINDLSYRNNICKDFINSDPNYAVIDGIPCKRVMKRFTKEQMDAINEYANNHGIDPVEAMHKLFD